MARILKWELREQDLSTIPKSYSSLIISPKVILLAYLTLFFFSYFQVDG